MGLSDQCLALEALTLIPHDPIRTVQEAVLHFLKRMSAANAQAAFEAFRSPVIALS
ncbi:MAG TPA: hypothetical protein PKK23_10790 [Nitrospirales bacterium]|nr:hypothetical protein [Nitrospirales bacterium]